MKRAAVAFALCAAAFAATPARACFAFLPCGEPTVYVAPYEADLPPPNILEVVKRRNDGGVSLAGFYNEPFQWSNFERVGGEPSYGETEQPAPGVIYSPWERPHRDDAHRRARFHAARFHAHIRRY